MKRKRKEVTDLKGWRCKKCGNEDIFHEVFPGGIYCYCSRCCSLNEKKRDYVYNSLGHNIHSAIRAGVENGIIEKISTGPNCENIQGDGRVLDDEVYA